MGRGTYFLKTSLNFQAMTRKTNWYQFAMTRDLLQGLTDPSTDEGSERNDVAMFVHVRFLRPVLGMNLFFMSLPLVLGVLAAIRSSTWASRWGTRPSSTEGMHLLPVSGGLQDPVPAAGCVASADRLRDDRDAALGSDQKLTRRD